MTGSTKIILSLSTYQGPLTATASGLINARNELPPGYLDHFGGLGVVLLLLQGGDAAMIPLISPVIVQDSIEFAELRVLEMITLNIDAVSRTVFHRTKY